MARNTTDPWRNDCEMSCSVPPDADRVIRCYCQTQGYPCRQGRSCPVRATNDPQTGSKAATVFMWVVIVVAVVAAVTHLISRAS